ncbi:MAG: hypothetical protein K1X61_15355 [Chitinophagales bacterium]|nr:hypothetical protein [Chitinophagales bacterium]
MKDKWLKLVFHFFLFIIVLLFTADPLTAQNTACCQDPACTQLAATYADKFITEVKMMGKYSDDDQVRQRAMDSVSHANAAGYKKMMQQVSAIHDWSADDNSRLDCMLEKMPADNIDATYWLSYLMGTRYASSFKSPEFVRGFGIFIHVNQGAINLFGKEEGYALTGGALLSYTFTKKGEEAGGSVRAMIGPSVFYSGQTVNLLVNPRMEWRLFDIGGELTSIGCVKLITEANLNDNLQIAGIGLGADISKFALQLNGGYEFSNDDFLLLLGIGYHIPVRKKN